jgi:hypothetical protein
MVWGPGFLRGCMRGVFVLGNGCFCQGLGVGVVGREFWEVEKLRRAGNQRSVGIPKEGQVGFLAAL